MKATPTVEACGTVVFFYPPESLVKGSSVWVMVQKGGDRIPSASHITKSLSEPLRIHRKVQHQVYVTELITKYTQLRVAIGRHLPTLLK